MSEVQTHCKLISSIFLEFIPILSPVRIGRNVSIIDRPLIIPQNLDIPKGGDFDARLSITMVFICDRSNCLIALGNSKYNLCGFGVTWYTNTRSEFENNTHGPYPALYKTIALP
jgi:hypothetical protein